MTNQIPEPLDVQMRKAREAREFDGESVVYFLLFTLVFDTVLVALLWMSGGGVPRLAQTVFWIDVALLVAWVLTIPVRRWMNRPPS